MSDDDWGFPEEGSGGDGFGFDAFDKATQIVSGLVPDGEVVNLLCVGAGMNKPEKGAGCWFKFQVAGGPYDGIQFYQQYSLKSDAAKRFTKSQMATMGANAQIAGEFTRPAQMLDHTIKAKVKVREWNGTQKNEIAEIA